MSEGAVLFSSVHFVLRAEKLLKEKGFSPKVIPIPRHLSSDCGVCLRIPWEKRQEITAILEGAGLKWEGVHRIDEDG